jgi:nucleotidyltransferase/DNA polymerase involved in DNA repair
VERSNILAPGFVCPIARTRTFFPPSPLACTNDWPWEVVSSYSSATAPGLHGISRADPLFQARKELNRYLSGRAQLLKVYFISIGCAPQAREIRQDLEINRARDLKYEVVVRLLRDFHRIIDCPLFVREHRLDARTFQNLPAVAAC